MNKSLAVLTLLLLMTIGANAQMTPWLQWTFLPERVMNEIIGETSGENAWHFIMETGGYDKDRSASEYETTFYETKYFLEKMKEYNLPGVELVRFPGGETWDAVKGELWEVSPMRQKLASYVDMAAMLAQGSVTTDVTAELVWVGLGRREDFAGRDVKNKIVVTEGPASSVHQIACMDSGAAGVISMFSQRPYFDATQIPFGGIRGDQENKRPAKFAFQLTPRDGEFLKKRLLAGEKISVRANVVAETRKYEIQDLTCYIPGTDPNAGEVIFSAHIHEGYVKQGGNDDISGCAAILEIARTLNTLIKEGRIPPPKRTIRFLWGPEFSGTGPWVKANKELMKKTLCDINMDMVGEWLSKNKSYMCLMRTTYGNPHYVNDVMENYFRFVGEGNQEHLQNRSNAFPVTHRIVAPTGADEPFTYSIETHYGASDHEVFNDWGVQVPGIMMIAWPDQWYHTSGDHVDKADPTQLKRVAVIGAASAYTIATADDMLAIKIAGEITTNAASRLAHQTVRGLEELNKATMESLPAAYKSSRAYVDAAATNEKNTLETVLQLAVDKKKVGEYIASSKKSVDQLVRTQMDLLERHMRATAEALKIESVKIELSATEKKASKVFPKPTEKVKANGYGGYREFLPRPQGGRGQRGEGARFDRSEMQLLINGRNSVLDIKNMLDTQSDRRADLQEVLNYLETLKTAGLVTVD
ncbi:MAG: M28 family peptidase [Ignavibacteriales bacterium]|nr:M28 family peptidase [Ignavibacteriales bacterium]